LLLTECVGRPLKRMLVGPSSLPLYNEFKKLLEKPRFMKGG